MKYKKLLDHVTSEKIKSTSRWRGLLMNEKTGAIFPATKWGMKQAEKEKRPYTEISVAFFFMPGDICVLNTVPLGVFDLAPYGMPGRFESRKSWKSEHTYIHDLFDKYESFPGMKVSMLDGRPLNARLLDDIVPDAKRLAQFEQRLGEIKDVFFVINRMQDKKPEYPSNTNYRTRDGRQRLVRDRRDLLKRLLDNPLSETPNWHKCLEPFYAEFWHNAMGYRSRTPRPTSRATGRMSGQGFSHFPLRRSHNRVFDNMIRFDKAALFRALRIIT